MTEHDESGKTTMLYSGNLALRERTMGRQLVQSWFSISCLKEVLIATLI
jgi:hypothetical protein